MTKQELKDLFLKFTEYTIPPGEEERVIKYLPTGYKKDSVGNYYYVIGKSDTLFTTHLDTYCSKIEKINHVIDKDDPFKIKTDGKTILGGDNKLGCCILIGMMEERIPGTYYFFIGEEPILNGGLVGSSEALKSNPEFFKKFKRCIAFDRREYGSIVVRQKARMCCSMDFAKSIADEFKRVGDIHWDEAGGFGYYTDTAVFMDVIPECTNLSAGGFGEHHKTEWVDLNYTYNVLKTACQVDFESLPVVRELEVRFSQEKTKLIINPYSAHTRKINYDEIIKLCKIFDLSLTRSVLKDNNQHVTVSRWLEDYDLDIYLNGIDIIVDDKKVTLKELKLIILDDFKDDVNEQLEYYIELYENGVEEGKKNIINILTLYDCRTIEQFRKLLK